ncbi:DUF4054 domain-containing protein, partial [Rhodovulum sulfidophilum]|nr:DUF4054 domain-containing protein [Rhodovulum sulfidophilum]
RGRPSGTDFPAPVVASIIEDAALMAGVCIAPYEPARQAAIVKWLAAHLIASTNGAAGTGAGSLTSMSLGDASETYAKAALTGEGLRATHFGQQALLLDTLGGLARLGRPRASAEVI